MEADIPCKLKFTTPTNGAILERVYVLHLPGAGGKQRKFGPSGYPLVVFSPPVIHSWIGYLRTEKDADSRSLIRLPPRKMSARQIIKR